MISADFLPKNPSTQPNILYIKFWNEVDGFSAKQMEEELLK